MALWQVRVLGAPGVAFDPVFLARAKVLQVYREKLPGLGRARFSLATKNPDARLLDPDLLLLRNVQIWRDGRCVFWGQPLQPQADLERVEFTCVGSLWPLTRLFFGPVENNYLDPNSDFEDGLTNWVGVNTTASVSSTWKAKGNQSAKLVQVTAGLDSYLQRQVTVTTTTVPVFYAAKALLHIPSAGWVGPAFEERGLYLELRNSANALVGSPQWEPINEATPRDASQPLRLESGITVPAGMTNAKIHTRLYSPGHSLGVYWDATAMATEESVGSSLTGDWPSVIMQRILNYAEEKKGPLGLGFALEGDAGSQPTVVRFHQFYDNGNIFDGLMEYVAMGAVEFDVTWPDDGSAMTFRAWVDRRGSHKPAATITLGTNVGEDLEWGADAAGVTTAPRWIGQGTGARKEVGRAVNLASVPRVLESVDTAPPEAPVDSLFARAAHTADEEARPKKTPRFAVRAGVIFDNRVDIGDTIPVVADHGYIQENASRRVASIDVDAERDLAVVGWE